MYLEQVHVAAFLSQRIGVMISKSTRKPLTVWRAPRTLRTMSFSLNCCAYVDLCELILPISESEEMDFVIKGHASSISTARPPAPTSPAYRTRAVLAMDFILVRRTFSGQQTGCLGRTA